MRNLLPRFVFTSLLFLAALWAQPVSPAAQSICANGSARFIEPRIFQLLLSPTGMATGDFNQDGALDLVVSHHVIGAGTPFAGAITTMLGNRRGGFATHSSIPITLNGSYAGGQSQLYVADFNRDNRLDIGALGVDAGFAFLFGNGDGSFQAPNVLRIEGQLVFGATVADFNGDNATDIALAGSSNNVYVRLSNGTGGFGPATIYPAPQTTGAIVAADFNGDGKHDLAYGSENNVRVLLNSGNGSFTLVTPAAATVVSFIEGLTAGDFNGDQKTDLIAVSLPGTRLLLGDNGGGFTVSDTIFSTSAYVPRAADFDGDQRLDAIAISGRATGAFIQWRGKAASGLAGGLERGKQYDLPGEAFGTTVGDFNGDNKPDVAFASRNPDGVVVVLNNGAGGWIAPRLTREESIPNNPLALGDFNRDGFPDVGGVNLPLWLNDQAGGFNIFSARTAIYSYATLLATGDFNRDQQLDFVYAGPNPFGTSPQLGISLRQGEMDFTNSVSLNVGVEPSALLVTDYNRDNNPDVALATVGDSKVSLFAGNGRGGLASPVTLSVGLEPRGIVTGDFTGDARPDFIVANRNSATLSLLRQAADGTFTVQFIGVNANPRNVFATDFNRDGKLDLLIPLDNRAAVLLFAGNGDGTFRVLSEVAVPFTGFELVTGDFTGDGNMDFAAWQNGSQGNGSFNVFVYAGNARGEFRFWQELLRAGTPRVFADDFNRDGITDILYAGSSLITNIPQCPVAATAPLVSVSAANYRADSLAPESIVAAFGTDFTTQTLNARTIPLPAQLGGVSITVRDRNNLERPAELFFVSPNQINYLIPWNLATGLATVTVTTSTNQTKRETILITPTAAGIFSANADGGLIPAAVLLRKPLNSNTITTEAVTQFDSATQRYVLRPIPARPNEELFLALFGTGWRQQKNILARFDGSGMRVLYAGAQGSLVGLDQMNLALPFSFSPGIHNIDISVDGKPDQRIGIHLQF